MIGVKDLIKLYKEPFDSNEKALKAAKKRMADRGESTRSKEGKEKLLEEVNIIISEWEDSSENGIKAHSIIRNREFSKNKNSVIETHSGDIDNISEKDIVLDREIYYYEKYLKSDLYQIHGKADKLFITKNGYINIDDYKSHKEIRRDYTYKKDKILFIRNYFSPIQNLIECEFNDAALQCSFYMYMAWLKNKRLRPGKIYLQHIKLNKDGTLTGEEIRMELPYLINEVKAIIQDYTKKQKN